MIKKIALILSFVFLFSCSRDDNSSNASDNNSDVSSNNGTILKSYKYNSATGTEHVFENYGTRYEKILSSGKLSKRYYYDTSNKMTLIEEYNSDGTVYSSLNFFYDTNNKINKILDKTKNGKTKSWVFTRTGNIVYGEYDDDISDTYNSDIRVRYTFNNNNLISKYEYFTKSLNTGNESHLAYVTFTYDGNNNITKMKRTSNGTHDLPNSNSGNTYEYSFAYDNAVNPLYKMYMNHYENYILIQNDSSDFDMPFGSIFRGFGKNNILNTTYPANYLLDKYKFVYTYNTSGMPKNAKTISTYTGNIGNDINFNYY